MFHYWLQARCIALVPVFIATRVRFKGIVLLKADDVKLGLHANEMVGG